MPSRHYTLLYTDPAGSRAKLGYAEIEGAMWAFSLVAIEGLDATLLARSPAQEDMQLLLRHIPQGVA